LAGADVARGFRKDRVTRFRAKEEKTMTGDLRTAASTLSLVGSLMVLGCGGSSLPPARVADTQSAISAASAVGAEQHPTASLHLKMARDQLQEAQTLIDKGKNDDARLLLDRAGADADLALIITREAEASQSAQRARNEVQTLENRTQ
jgi:hypothetical protein